MISRFSLRKGFPLKFAQRFAFSKIQFGKKFSTTEGNKTTNSPNYKELEDVKIKRIDSIEGNRVTLILIVAPNERRHSRW
jgi:hypothetical protein